MITNSGANQSILGSNWFVLEETDRTTSVEGWALGLSRDNMKIINGITKTSLPTGETILLRVNEGVYLGEGDSLLSSNQVGHNGIHIDHNIHFDSGYIITSHDVGFDLPLTQRGGLTFVNIAKPTEDELERYPIMQLTEDLPWDPNNICTPSSFANLSRACLPSHTNAEIKTLQHRFAHRNLETTEKTL